jgi:hypothetical protein
MTRRLFTHLHSSIRRLAGFAMRAALLFAAWLALPATGFA